MELVLLLLSAGLIILLLSLFLYVYVRLLYSQSQSLKLLPPGETGWPLLGETLEFLSAGRKGTPEKFVMDRMAKHSSPRIFKTSLIGEKMAVFCGPSGNKFLFSNENKLVTSWYPRNVDKIFTAAALQSSTGEESIKMRKLTSGFVGPDSLRKYVGIMDSMARNHLETHWDLETITVLPLAHKYTFAVACRLFLSIDDPQQIARLEKPFHVIVAGILAIPINFPGTSFNRAIRASQFIRKELLEIIRGRQRKLPLMTTTDDHHDDDILDHMLTTTDDNGRFMTEQNVADKIMGMLVGGHDTLSATITFILNYLADHPHIYDQVLEEQIRIADGKGPGEVLSWEDCQKMKYSWNVVSEVLRLASPLQGTFREAITDFTYAGFYIPKGFKLYWTTNSTHKYPDYFPEPDKFDPSRFDDHRNGGDHVPYAYVPFGGGPRMCPGKDYARVGILAFMYNLVRMFRWEKVLPNEKIVVDPMPMPANGLPIRLYRHN